MSPHTITRKGFAEGKTRQRRDSLFGVGVKYPNFSEEKKLWRKGYKYIVGLDEAGRGPLAGPVVAAAVLFKNLNPVRNQKFLNGVKLRIKNLKLRDSKKLSSKAREKFYRILTMYPGIEWGIGRVSEKMIDKINILEATKLAMKRAIEKLKRKPDVLIIDGNFKLNFNSHGRIRIPERKRGCAFRMPQKSIVRADQKVFSCAAASILAKVRRDRIMIGYHKKYPKYGFDRHKGYPTKLHRKMLKKYGPSVIHRLTFTPVFKMIK